MRNKPLETIRISKTISVFVRRYVLLLTQNDIHEYLCKVNLYIFTIQQLHG